MNMRGLNVKYYLNTKSLALLLVIILSVVTPSKTRSYSVKCIKVYPSTTTLITMLQPRFDPELAQVHAKYLDKNIALWGIDRYTYISVINRESEYNPMAVSKKGAKGLAQVLIRNHKELIRKRRLMPHEVFYLDHNYSLGCEILYNAKKNSHNLNETLIHYAGGNPSGYISGIRKDIEKCKSLESTKVIIGEG